MGSDSEGPRTGALPILISLMQETSCTMLTGTPPHPETARDFDICLILHAEHSFNASTFAGREVASTHAHMYASIAAALGALSGELHGGANSEVMKMLLEIKEVERVRTMGFRETSERGKGHGDGTCGLSHRRPEGHHPQGDM